MFHKHPHSFLEENIFQLTRNKNLPNRLLLDMTELKILNFSAASEYLELSINFKVLDHKVNSSSSPSFSINSARGLFNSIFSSATSSSFDNKIIASSSWILLSKSTYLA